MNNLDLDNTITECALGILRNPKMDTLQIRVSDRHSIDKERYSKLYELNL